MKKKTYYTGSIITIMILIDVIVEIMYKTNLPTGYFILLILTNLLALVVIQTVREYHRAQDSSNDDEDRFNQRLNNLR